MTTCPSWVSPEAEPCPGKCFNTGVSPAACHAATYTDAQPATSAGPPTNNRFSPSGSLPTRGRTSTTGPSTTSTPVAATSRACSASKACTSATGRWESSSCDASGCSTRRRCTAPPSSSVAISSPWGASASSSARWPARPAAKAASGAISRTPPTCWSRTNAWACGHCALLTAGHTSRATRSRSGHACTHCSRGETGAVVVGGRVDVAGAVVVVAAVVEVGCAWLTGVVATERVVDWHATRATSAASPSGER